MSIAITRTILFMGRDSLSVLLRNCQNLKFSPISGINKQHTRGLNYGINVAIVGSGPAGFYTAQKLLRNPAINVDIYERLPVPFGLVRFGVAPDHAEVKNVIDTFTTVANNNRVNFFGNVSVGQDLSLEDLFSGYHAVVLCYGSSLDRYLNIEGESTSNVVSARQLVGWYNGVPADKDLKLNLDCDTACIIGQGNVALDCARILLKPPGLSKTDICSKAYDRIENSKIKRLVIVGRRGPIQVAFTTREFREILKFDHCSISVAPNEIKGLLRDGEALKILSRQRRRLTDLIAQASIDSLPPPAPPKSSYTREFNCELKFLRTPIKIVPTDDGSMVDKIVLAKNKFEDDKNFYDEKASVITTEETEEIKCGLVIRSIGYKAVLIDKSLPYDHKLGAIINHNGRVQGFSGLYCSGWLATGSTGVIVGTLQSSLVTSNTLLEDIEKNTVPELRIRKGGHKSIVPMLEAKSVQVVHFNDWLKIDKLEKKIGEMMGKPREKFVEVDQMLRVAKSDKDDDEPKAT